MMFYWERNSNNTKQKIEVLLTFNKPPSIVVMDKVIVQDALQSLVLIL